MSAAREQLKTDVDVVVVGAGFAGLYMLHRLLRAGCSVRVFERGSGPGGTWFWNRYPGARCDVESMDYSYSFSPELEQEWVWSERYPTQPEILRYLNHVTDRFDLRRHISFDTRVTEVHYDEKRACWLLRTSAGESLSARYCVMATGCLSSTNKPAFKGLASFQGRWYHTGQWPPDGVDFSRQRVGVIGTGSTAIQAIPRIARQARHLYVFQRTPNFSVPAHNGPLDAETQRQVKANYAARREKARYSRAGLPLDAAEEGALEVSPEERQSTYEARWAEGGVGFLRGYKDLLTSAEANETAAEFVRSKIAETVCDPAVATLLMPRDYPIGTKRLCVDIDYYQTYNRDNVTLVDVRTAPIEELTPRGLRTETAEYELDAIVFAIGFDAMTGALFEIDLRGRGGEPLKSRWAQGPRTYLGLAVAGFPNLFLVTGPGSPSVLSNMVVSIEQHVDWIADCIAYLGERGLDRIEATPAAEEHWQRHVDDVARLTLYPRARSWYMGANIPGKPRVFMPYVGGVGAYRHICDDVAASGYRGFELSR
ncbi:MAG: NAD(P)/FAD-dependent oxidoreductase [Chloroflexi bacterium]|nr:NAD(P)/FAD-dependent oxidoreductase [Chloroflexota bacterium]